MARILVVDDDPDVLNLLSKLLSIQGHTVFRAEDAMKAMDYLNNHSFDLVISDARMPRFSGFELVRTIRNNKRFQGMCVAMLTSLNEKKNIEQAIRAGVDEYIIKPIDPLLLIEKVENLFSKKPARELVDYEFPEDHKLAVAEANMGLRLVSINECGVTFFFPRAMSEDVVLRIKSPLFEKIQIDSPQVQVIASTPVKGGFHVETSFKALRDYESKKIRDWIEVHGKGKVA